MTINTQLQEMQYHTRVTNRTLEIIRRHRTVPRTILRRYYEISEHARGWGINTEFEDLKVLGSLEGREII
ncbi:MAG: hypothetical protein KKB31_03445 [Nanoarchaeota archaeon]|nr:hypothetical protein [Nanoarchaeota archaeon]